MTYHTFNKQGIAQRASLLVLSFALITMTLAIQGPLGGYVVLPLLAIVPGISALIGWDPVFATAAACWNRFAVTRAPIQANA
jgi:hypothetical protein